ncbi:hypothetical protein FISHEDRAFT_58418 [Fistulina hepatica ATCC 64428]|nr:hypothetical protein FISHEDRAFT_58418 [Fistulina hepatica ATCC 64428]
MSGWSFGFRSGFDDGLSDGDEVEVHFDAPCSDGLSEEARQINEFDLSIRQDTVNYRPNPFSIAKINAAAREASSGARTPIAKKTSASIPCNTKNTNRNKSSVQTTLSFMTQGAKSRVQSPYGLLPNALNSASDATHVSVNGFPSKPSLAQASSRSTQRDDDSTSNRQRNRPWTPCHDSPFLQDSNPQAIAMLSPKMLSTDNAVRKRRKIALKPDTQTPLPQASFCGNENNASSIAIHSSPDVRVGAYHNMAFFDEDEEWTTFLGPRTKRGKTDAEIRTSAKFRIPLLSFDPPNNPSTKKGHFSGVGSSSPRRTITFLPPPMHRDPNVGKLAASPQRSQDAAGFACGAAFIPEATRLLQSALSENCSHSGRNLQEVGPAKSDLRNSIGDAPAHEDHDARIDVDMPMNGLSDRYSWVMMDRRMPLPIAGYLASLPVSFISLPSFVTLKLRCYVWVVRRCLITDFPICIVAQANDAVWNILRLSSCGVVYLDASRDERMHKDMTIVSWSGASPAIG